MVHGESRYSVFVWWLDVLPIMALQTMDPISTDKCHLSLPCNIGSSPPAFRSISH